MPKDASAVPSDEIRIRPPDGIAVKRTPAQVLREARARDSEIKRGRVLTTLDEMVAAGEKITFRGLARTAGVSAWLVYSEGLRERIEAEIEKQDRAVREVKAGPSAESLAADLELATAELRTLRAERDRLKAEMTQLREALKTSEEKLKAAHKDNHSPSDAAQGNDTKRGPINVTPIADSAEPAGHSPVM